MTLTPEDKKWIDERLATRLESLETKMLTEFHKFAEANDARVRSHGAAIRALELQLENFEDRLRKVEGRQ